MFVGDCKYKKTEEIIPNADVYQMLAYLTALQLTYGLLVYAAGQDLPHTITIPFADKRVLVQTIGVSQAPKDREVKRHPSAIGSEQAEKRLAAVRPRSGAEGPSTLIAHADVSYPILALFAVPC